MATQPRRQSQRKQLSRKPRKSSARPRRRLFVTRVVVPCAALLAVLLIWAAVARNTAARSNTTRQTFDAIIVLGTPTDSDGNPSSVMLDRVSEGIREYERGIAPRLIFTGGAAHNHFTEAAAMARIARSRGVPASAILEEPRALDTLQNACYSARILAQRNLHSAEVVSSPSHLPRAAMIFSHLPSQFALAWRVHPAADNLTPSIEESAAGAVEVLKTARYLIWARWSERCSA